MLLLHYISRLRRFTLQLNFCHTTIEGLTIRLNDLNSFVKVKDKLVAFFSYKYNVSLALLITVHYFIDSMLFSFSPLSQISHIFIRIIFIFRVFVFFFRIIPGLNIIY
jgi:hypothetical protein